MKNKFLFLILLSILVIVQISCGSSAPIVSTATSPAESSIEDSSPTEEIREEPIAIPTVEPTAIPTVKPTPTAQLGTRRDNPAPVGSTITIDDMELQVITFTRPADSIVKAGNMFNTDPETGKEYLFVEITAKCVKDSTESCSISVFNLKMVGSLGIKYDAEWFLSGVEGLLEDTDFYGGTLVSGNVAFIVGIDETDLLVIYEPFFQDPAYFDLD